jgi:hypothetical protein
MIFGDEGRFAENSAVRDPELPFERQAATVLPF